MEWTALVVSEYEVVVCVAVIGGLILGDGGTGIAMACFGIVAGHTGSEEAFSLGVD